MLRVRSAPKVIVMRKQDIVDISYWHSLHCLLILVVTAWVTTKCLLYEPPMYMEPENVRIGSWELELKTIAFEVGKQ